MLSRVFTILSFTATMVGVASCSDSGASPTEAPAAPLATPTPVTSQWNGSIRLAAVGPQGSCTASFLQSHPEFFGQTVEAELREYAGSAATLRLQTSGGEVCVLEGAVEAETIRVSASHPTCAVPGTTHAEEATLWSSCHWPWDGLDPDSPVLQWSKVTVSRTDSSLRGEWSYTMLGTPPWTVKMEVALTRH